VLLPPFASIYFLSARTLTPIFFLLFYAFAPFSIIYLLGYPSVQRILVFPEPRWEKRLGGKGKDFQSLSIVLCFI